MKNTKTTNEVLGVLAPKNASDPSNYDKHCPFTAGFAVKNELLRGKVVKKDNNKSATIEWSRPRYVSKYERYEVRRFRLRAHNPPAVDAQIGQEVLVARTRPISKTKNHVIIKILSDVKEDIKGEDTSVEMKEKKKPEEQTKESSGEQTQSTKKETGSE